MKRLENKFVKQQFENAGYKLLSEYKNCMVKDLIECPNGHQYKVTYNKFQQGKKCPICYGNKKLTYDFVKTQIENEGYELLSKKYKNNNTKLLVECPQKHQYKVTYDNFKQGCRCAICAGNRKLTYDFVKQQFENVGYKLLSKEYIGVLSKLKVKCPKKHIYEIKYGNFQQGKRCPVCWNINNYSRSEKDCLHVVKQLTNENIIENDRTQLVNPKTHRFLELDIWIPSLNKAIEFNGECWHSNENSKYKDKQKVKQCKEKNIDFIVINYQDWINNRQKQIKKIKDFIGGKDVKFNC